MEEKEIKITEADKAKLKTAATWARFIAIISFVIYGLSIVGMLFGLLAIGIAGSTPAIPQMYGSMGQTYYIVLFSVCIVLYIVMLLPTLYMYNFAVKALDAVVEDNEAAMSESLANLRKYFKFQGIWLIVSMAIGVLMVVLLMAVGIGAAILGS
jgi:hypothetical protein